MSGCPVFFIEEQDFFKPLQGDEIHLSWDQFTGCEMLYNAVDSRPNPTSIVVSCGDIEACWNQFAECHKVVEAAGGLVFNSQGACLFIYRRGHWDLPKGKIEKREAQDDAALREVKEECGFSNVSIRKFLTTTYHTYFERGKRILKPSHWYIMQSEEAFEELAPQTEEDITELKWVMPDEVDAIFQKTYPMIPELYAEAQSSQTFIR